LVTLKGVAVPYDKTSVAPAFSDGMRGTVDQNAFFEMERLPCTLQIGHAVDAIELASVDDGTLTLIDRPIGVLFQASVDPSAHADCEWLNTMTSFGCSAGDIQASCTDKEVNGITVRAITQGTFGHLALVMAPAYESAICWRDGAVIPPWNLKLTEAVAAFKSYAPRKTTPVTRTPPSNSSGQLKRAAAKAFRESDTRTNRLFGDLNPHQAVRLATAPAPTAPPAPPAPAPEDRTEGKTTIQLMLEAMDNMVDSLHELFERVHALENKRDGDG
jgi:hypothetical protein